MPSKPSFKLLDRQLAKQSQSVLLKLTMEFNGHKVLLTLKNDAYKNQCVALAQVWRPSQLDWSKVVSLIPENLRMREGAVYMPRDTGVSEATFSQDLEELKRQVALILG